MYIGDMCLHILLMSTWWKKFRNHSSGHESILLLLENIEEKRRVRRREKEEEINTYAYHTSPAHVYISDACRLIAMTIMDLETAPHMALQHMNFIDPNQVTLYSQLDSTTRGDMGTAKGHISLGCHVVLWSSVYCVCISFVIVNVQH